MFQNDVIRHELNGAGVAEDCTDWSTTRRNFERLRFDINLRMDYEWRF